MSFIMTLFLLSSCTEDVKFNNPAFQTLKDNVFWRAQTYRAYLDGDGKIIVEGYLGFETVKLQTASSTQRTYILGVDNTSKAFYSDGNQSEAAEFTTGTNIGNGQIVITDYNTETGTISGTFKFNARNVDESDTQNLKVNFTEGVFYKIPVEFSPIVHYL